MSGRRNRTCPHCEGPLNYSSYYDTFGCKKCLRWAEPICKCTPSECEFKRRRATRSRPHKEDFDE